MGTLSGFETSKGVFKKVCIEESNHAAVKAIQSLALLVLVPIAFVFSLVSAGLYVLTGCCTEEAKGAQLEQSPQELFEQEDELAEEQLKVQEEFKKTQGSSNSSSISSEPKLSPRGKAKETEVQETQPAISQIGNSSEVPPQNSESSAKGSPEAEQATQNSVEKNNQPTPTSPETKGSGSKLEDDDEKSSTPLTHPSPEQPLQVETDTVITIAPGRDGNPIITTEQREPATVQTENSGAQKLNIEVEVERATVNMNPDDTKTVTLEEAVTAAEITVPTPTLAQEAEPADEKKVG